MEKNEEKENLGTKSIGGGGAVIQSGARDANQKDKRLLLAFKPKI